MKIPCKEASLDFHESYSMHDLPPNLSNENPMASMLHIPGYFFSNHYPETVLFSSLNAIVGFKLKIWRILIRAG